MRLWRNLLAGLGGTVLSAAVGLAAVPIYVRYLGLNAYGLVGFYVALQTMFQMLDLGISPTMSREVARWSGGSGDVDEARDLLHTLGLVFWGLGTAIAVGVFAAAGWLGTDWLKTDAGSRESIVAAIKLMAVAIGLRFPVGLYLSVLQGAHRQAEASLLNAAIAVVGAIGAIVVLAVIAPTVEAFFGWQILVAAAQVICARWAAWRVLIGTRHPRATAAGLSRVWRFSLGMSVVSLLGVLLSQLDKIVLSRAVDLPELGRYTLAGMPARSLALLVAPVFAVVFPRMSASLAAGAQASVIDLYKNGTRLFLSCLFPLAAFVGIFAADILTIWTGDVALSALIAPVAALLIAGSAINATMIFPYSLQLANGQSRLPAVITAALIGGFIPLLIWLIAGYGILGGAAAWLALNLAYLPFGTWLTHRVILPGEGWGWIAGDVGVPAATTVVVFGGGALLIKALASTIVVRLMLGGVLAAAVPLVVVSLSPRLLSRLEVAIPLRRMTRWMRRRLPTGSRNGI